MGWRVEHADCIEAMATLPEGSIDAIVCDPPYGLGFMGKAWDDLPPGLLWAQRCLRVLKPGGHLLAFGGTRTSHRMVCAIEDAGFEIRDTICWLYGTGFPKSLNVSKAIDKAAGAARSIVGQDPNWRAQAHGEAVYSGGLLRPKFLTAPTTAEAEQWEGWGTALKPAHEPIVVARKPLVGTVAGNVLAHGTGALNVDGCRIGAGGGGGHDGEASAERRYSSNGATSFAATPAPRGGDALGRWPANVVLDEEAAALLDEQTGPLHSQNPATRRSRSTVVGVTAMGTGASIEYADSGGASRFFYVAKTSSAERNAGLEEFEEQRDGMRNSAGRPLAGHDFDPVTRNTHPTVKPIAFMRWLVRLVTPPAGLVLDPFCGSGSTGCATVLEGFGFHGIEREAEYVELAKARIAYWERQIPVPPAQAELFA